MNQLTLEAFRFRGQHLMLNVEGLKPVNLSLLPKSNPAVANGAVHLMVTQLQPNTDAQCQHKTMTKA